jgi:hypothetical protein
MRALGACRAVGALAALLRLPQPAFRWVLGTEWFVRRDPADATEAALR